jgi:hypothetical protein
MTGRVLGAATAQDASEYIQFNYISTVVTQAIWVAPYACIVTDIRGRTRVAGSGGACTFSFYKVPDITAVASGTLLHSGTFDLVGTADTNQILKLVTNQDSLTLKAGDAIGVAITGTATSAVGCVGVTLEPVT